jgi:long-chain acyl-CoA synthetase
VAKPSNPRRNSIAEFFPEFDRRPRDIVYAQPYGYRTARWTYRRFADTAAQFARELESRGISPGDRVLLWGPNSAEWAASFWGCMLRGAVVVPMDWIATDDFALRVVDQVQAKLLVVAKEKFSALQNAPVMTLEDLPQTVSRHSAGKPGARYDSPKLDRNSLAEIVFTSGTTAEPKGVMITHGNILANLEPVEEEIRKYVKFEWPFHPIRFLNLLPLSHVFGQFLGLFFPAVLSGAVFFEDSFNPADMIRTIHDERISVLVAVPRVLDSLKHKLERDIEDAGRSAKFTSEFNAAKGERFYSHWLRFWGIHREFGLKFWAMICGGASLSRDTEEFWDRLGIAVVQGYGLTETTSLISLNHPFQLGRGSIGKILPGREVKLGPGCEILVRGDSVATGYWRGANPAGSPPAPSSTEDEGWLHTGDIGELDAEGNLYFKGRQKNVIVTSAGMNVYPADIETALRRQPEIRDCIVLAIPQAAETEAVAVLLLRDPNSGAKAAVERANSELAEYQRIRRWFVWPEPDFPRTSTGKPRTNLISARVAAPESRAPEQTPRAAQQGTLEDLIAQITHRSVASLQPNAKLEADLGLSSLDRVELLSALEDRYLVSFNEADVSGDTTIADLRRLLDQPISAPGVPQPVATTQSPEEIKSETLARSSAAVESATPTQPAPAPLSMPLQSRSIDTFPRWAQRWPAAWTRNFIYTILSWPATHILAHPRVRGRENLASVRGQLLIVCNHISEVDTGYIAAALPAHYRYRLAIAMDGERLRAMRRPSTARGFWGGLLDRMNYFLVTLLFNVFPLPKKSGFRQAFRYAGESVDRGYSLIVFPEGDLTPDGSIKRFRSGIGLLAQNMHVPILPMRIDGLFELRQKHRRTAPWGHVRVSIGDPVEFPAGTPPEEIAQQLQNRVAALEWPK